MPHATVTTISCCQPAVPPMRACSSSASGHDTVAEVTALLAWDGRGAVRLQEASLGDGALLLEQLDSGRALSGLGLFDAAEIAGDLIRQLTIPAPPGLGQLRDMATDIAQTLKAPAERPGWPGPCPPGRPGHPARRRTGRRGRRRPGPRGSALRQHPCRNPPAWLAIDPKAIAGDPELSVPELMWTRLDEAKPPATSAPCSQRSLAPRPWTLRRPGHGPSSERSTTGCGAWITASPRTRFAATGSSTHWPGDPRDALAGPGV